LHVTEGAAPAITGINHLSVTVRDIEPSVAWYQRVFRAERIPMTFPHYGREETGYGVLLLEPRSGLAIGLHTNTGNNGAPFDEAQTGMDHVGFNVTGLAELESWVTWLDELGIEHTGIRTGDEPFPYATLVFRDPDNIQLELFAGPLS
jgi:glyoxylase I family protein